MKGAAANEELSSLHCTFELFEIFHGIQKQSLKSIRLPAYNDVEFQPITYFIEISHVFLAVHLLHNPCLIRTCCVFLASLMDAEKKMVEYC